MSDYGINLKLNLEGNNKLRTLYQDFKNLETQIGKTQQTIKELTRKNKELKLEQSNLGSAIVQVGKGAEVTVKFLTALGKTFFDNKKAVKESNKEIREAKRALKDLKEEASVVRKNTVENAKAFQQNSGILKESTGTLRRYIEEWERLRATTRARDIGTKNTLIDSITKADFTLQFKQLDNYVKKINRVADAYKRMAGGNDSVKFGAFRGMGNLLGFDPGKTESGIKRYIRVLENLRQQLDRTGKEYREVTTRIQQMNSELNKGAFDIQGVSAREGDANFYGPKPSRKTQMFSMPGGMFYQPGGMAARRKEGLNSALIGGAFPALFGQGLGASIGGGLGGLGGGMLGGGLGFGLSLVGTQLGAQVDKMIAKSKELAAALDDPINNIETLVKAMGQVGTEFGKTLSVLDKMGLKGVAAEAAMLKFNEQFGNLTSKSLRELNKEQMDLNNQLNILGTSISILVAGPLASFIKKINEGITGPQSDVDKVFKYFKSGPASRLPQTRVVAQQQFKEITGQDVKKWIDNEIPKSILESDDFKKNVRTFLDTHMDPEGAEGREKKEKAALMIKKALNKERAFEVKTLTDQLAIEKLSLTARGEDLNVMKQQIEFRKINNELAKLEHEIRVATMMDDTEKAAELQHEKDKLQVQKDINKAKLANAEILASPVRSAVVDLEKEIKKLTNAQYALVEISDAISSSFSSSFKGVINGTISVQQAFANMFSRIADSFLDMAAQMIAMHIKMKILGLFLPSIMSGPGGGYFDPMTGKGVAGPNYGLADGGKARRGQSYVVGEEGPELFVPGSTGTVIPNHELGGGGTSIIVNVDASGSSVEGEEEQARELGDMLAAAIQAEIVKQKRPGGLLA
jgi:hypothetical protein